VPRPPLSEGLPVFGAPVERAPESVLVADLAEINRVAEQAIELPAGDGIVALRTSESEAMFLGPKVAAIGFLGLMAPDVEQG